MLSVFSLPPKGFSFYIFSPFQSVAALLDKFKKSDQAFDINAEIDSDPGDYSEDPVENDFDADIPAETVEKDRSEFSEKLELCRQTPGMLRYVEEGLCRNQAFCVVVPTLWNSHQIDMVTIVF